MSKLSNREVFSITFLLTIVSLIVFFLFEQNYPVSYRPNMLFLLLIPVLLGALTVAILSIKWKEFSLRLKVYTCCVFCIFGLQVLIGTVQLAFFILNFITGKI